MMLTTSLNPDDREKADGNPYVSSFLSKPLNREKISQLVALGGGTSLGR
jgi:hypothetical protein